MFLPSEVQEGPAAFSRYVRRVEWRRAKSYARRKSFAAPSFRASRVSSGEIRTSMKWPLRSRSALRNDPDSQGPCAPTLKVKRRVIEVKYRAEIEALYC